MNAECRRNTFHILSMPELAGQPQSFRHGQRMFKPSRVGNDMEELVQGLLGNAQTPAVLANLTSKAVTNRSMVHGAGHRPMHQDVGINAQDPISGTLLSTHRSSISS